MDFSNETTLKSANAAGPLLSFVVLRVLHHGARAMLWSCRKLEYQGWS